MVEGVVIGVVRGVVEGVVIGMVRGVVEGVVTGVVKGVANNVCAAVLTSADISTLASSFVSVIQSLATLSSGPAFNLVIKGKSPSPHFSVRPLSYTRYSEKYDGSSNTLEQG